MRAKERIREEIEPESASVTSLRDRNLHSSNGYIEMFYNPKRRHSFSNDLSPVEYEKQYFQRLSSV
jgi:transposase InsO family protein